MSYPRPRHPRRLSTSRCSKPSKRTLNSVEKLSGNSTFCYAHKKKRMRKRDTVHSTLRSRRIKSVTAEKLERDKRMRSFFLLWWYFACYLFFLLSLCSSLFCVDVYSGAAVNILLALLTMVRVMRSISCLSLVLCWRKGEWPLSSL